MVGKINGDREDELKVSYWIIMIKITRFGGCTIERHEQDKHALN